MPGYKPTKPNIGNSRNSNSKTANSNAGNSNVRKKSLPSGKENLPTRESNSSEAESFRQQQQLDAKKITTVSTSNINSLWNNKNNTGDAAANPTANHKKTAEVPAVLAVTGNAAAKATPANYKKPEQVTINLPKEVTDVMEVLRKSTYLGKDTYVVGGAPRDLILGKTPNDYDLITKHKRE